MIMLGKTPVSAILAVNGKFLGAFASAALAWLFWPESARNWQAGMLSIFCSALAIAMSINVLITMAKIYAREKQVAALLAQGRSIRSAELAGPDALKQAGMRDD